MDQSKKPHLPRTLQLFSDTAGMRASAERVVEQARRARDDDPAARKQAILKSEGRGASGWRQTYAQPGMAVL